MAQLTANSQAYTPQRLNPPREGPALLQGLLICGYCGERMTVRYHQRSGQRIVPDYLCQQRSIARGVAPCQRFGGRDLDAAVAKLLLEVVTPETVSQTLAIQDELLTQLDDAERLRQRAVERAQYEADVAQRRFLRVDPDNRLVASVLEAEWNGKLRALTEAREVAEQQRQRDQARLSAAERKAMLELPEGLARLWQDSQTADRDRKRIARLVIEDITVRKADQLIAQIRFTGGATHTLSVTLPPPFAHSRFTPPETLAALDKLIDSYTDAEVAEHLNDQGYRTFVG